MWVDAPSQRMRVDVFGGLDSTLTLQVTGNTAASAAAAAAKAAKAAAAAQNQQRRQLTNSSQLHAATS
jgi:hypothetical protein